MSTKLRRLASRPAVARYSHRAAIQASFGRHDVSGIEAHVGGAATVASEAIGAEAYATGNHVAFRSAPDLHTAAHEAAHVVQQRAGVALKGGVGEAHDPYEQHADAVADLVVSGRSAEPLLDQMASSSSAASPSGAVQRKNLAQHSKAGGLIEDGTGPITHFKNQKGKVYAQSVESAGAGRIAALTTAAARNAEIGNRIVDLRFVTSDDVPFDDEKCEDLDPFLYKVTVPFSEGETQHSLTLMYQHALR